MKTQRQIAETVRRVRLQAGLSIRDLARAAGVNPNTIYKLESGGGMRVSTVPKIAKALHVSEAKLLGL